MAARRTTERTTQQVGSITTNSRCRSVCHAAGNGQRQSLRSLKRLLIEQLVLSWTHVGSGKPNSLD